MLTKILEEIRETWRVVKNFKSKEDFQLDPEMDLDSVWCDWWKRFKKWSKSFKVEDGNQKKILVPVVNTGID